jgi:hypothetical protein
LVEQLIRNQQVVGSSPTAGSSKITIGTADRPVAGIVLTAGGILTARNDRHFGGVAGLRLSGRYEK